MTNYTPNPNMLRLKKCAKFIQFVCNRKFMTCIVCMLEKYGQNFASLNKALAEKLS